MFDYWALHLCSNAEWRLQGLAAAYLLLTTIFCHRADVRTLPSNPIGNVWMPGRIAPGTKMEMRRYLDCDFTPCRNAQTSFENTPGKTKVRYLAITPLIFKLDLWLTNLIFPCKRMNASFC